MKQTNLNIFRINTTAYDEEDFVLLTSLNKKQINKIIKPIVKAERLNEDYYDNDILFNALLNAYPNHVVIMYQTEGIETISI